MPVLRPPCVAIARITTRYGEQERETNIARNRALLEQLELKDVVATFGVPEKSIPAVKSVKCELAEEAPRRQSARLQKDVVDPNETPAQKRKRMAEAEGRRKTEEGRIFAHGLTPERLRSSKPCRNYALGVVRRALHF